MTGLKYIFLGIVFSLCFSSITAQINPAQLDHVLIKGTVSDQVVLNSFFLQPSVVHTEVENGVGWGQLSSFTSLGNGQWGAYLTGGTEISEVSFTVKYYVQNAPSIIPKARYTKIRLETVNSIVDAGTDYALSNSGNVNVSVLDNDENNLDVLAVNHISRNQDLIGLINGSEIELSPLSSDKKMYAQYIAEDTLGTTDVATIVLVPSNEPTENIHENHFTTNKASLNFTLPSTGFELNSGFGLANGSLNVVNNFAFSYTPDETYYGLDSIQFIHDNGNLHTITVEIFNEDVVGSFLVDDIVQTAQEGVVFFNVRSNDLENNLNILYSSADDHDELEYLGNGEFKYTAPDGFYGVVNYEYACIYLGEVKTANIKVIVDDHEPSIYPYKFNVRKNTPFVIDYQVPVSGESFEIKETPHNGTLQILETGEVLTTDCYEISGKDKIVYIPNADFVGSDNFEIQYQLNSNNNAYNLLSYIEVLDSEESCLCVEDCVWKGDVNNDGIVDLLDLFSFGRYFGTTTEPRTDVNDDWVGLSSASNQPNKYADINGDGVVTENDLDDFFEFYENSHNYYKPTSLISTEYDIQFVPQVTEIDSGELLRIDVVLGSVDFPAISVDGISFGLNVAPTIADSSSMDVVYKSNSWFCHNDPTMALTHVPYDGRIETAVVNTANASQSGIGIVATLEFIVEEDLDGFRLGEDSEPVLSVEFDDIYIAGKDGKTYKLANQTVDIPWAKKDDNINPEAFDPNDFIVYPNPSDGLYNLFLNGNDHIQSINVFSTSGFQLASSSNINSDNYQLDMSNYPIGIYLIQITSENHSYTQKVELIK